MSKRSRKRTGGMFDGLENVPSLEESSDAIFGVSPFPNTLQIKVKLVDIHSIYPDPAQPRRAIPSELRDKWDVNKDPFEDLIAYWFTYMEPDFDLDAYLLDGETKRARLGSDNEPLNPDFQPTNAVQASLLHLLELASSILRDGLTNPITVSRIGRDYMIETGERRWLAYQLLHVYFEDTGDTDWSKIPARILTERSVWRQATENNARQNLNAISRARQLSILLMDIHGWENFRPISDFEAEQDFYAQVGDGRVWRIPREKTEQLLKAMGLTNQTQLRQYRAILRIDQRSWELADDNDLTENAIRKIMKNRTSKSVTPVTERVQKTTLDDALHNLQKQRDSFADQAQQAKKIERNQWLQIAKEQADWWDRLVRKLDNKR